MKQRLYIVKIGGAILEKQSYLQALLDDFAQLQGEKILVHGGGKSASELARKLGVEAPLIEGRRVTNEAMLEVALMTYGGLKNRTLVAQLQARGCMALGLGGADLDMIRAQKRSQQAIDFGFVGDILKVNVENLFKLLQGGICPVFASLSHDGQGQMLNTNADSIASHLAQAMSPGFEVKLIYLFEKKGVLKDLSDEESLIGSLDPTSFAEAKEKGSISEGMIPKLENAFQALEAGVSVVRIGRYDSLKSLDQENYPGTSLHQQAKL